MALYSCEIQRMESATNFVSIDSKLLVPGDVILVPDGKNLPCDMILLTGSVIVNEAMLTGESIPVMKASIPIGSSELYTEEGAVKHTLFGGTKVIQTRPVGDEPVIALVTNTAFLTTKGALIRDILYPKEIQFDFKSDGNRFTFIIAFLAIIGCCAVIKFELDMGIEDKIIVNRFLDIITQAVPPALPAVLACGVVFAINRLKKKNIFCIAPPRINLAGQI
jgi:magnesium-transporting ATPase (P-type)